MSRKRFCVLQVTPEEPNPHHLKMFGDKDESDFYFVTHDAPHEDALAFCPNTTWTDTRNILAAKVPKQYDYYAFVDYDYNFQPLRNLDADAQILEDLKVYKKFLSPTKFGTPPPPTWPQPPKKHERSPRIGF